VVVLSGFLRLDFKAHSGFWVKSNIGIESRVLGFACRQVGSGVKADRVPAGKRRRTQAEASDVVRIGITKNMRTNMRKDRQNKRKEEFLAQEEKLQVQLR
jgi:hypothetical protein